MADRPADERARLGSARRSRFEEADRQPLRGLGSGETPGGLDEVETPAKAPLMEHLLEPAGRRPT